MNLQKIMKQAQAMQKKMDEVQKKLADTDYEGDAGGGMVNATVNGKGEFKGLKIDPSLLDPNDTEVLEDMVIAAFNKAKKKADEASESELSNMAGGLGLPPGFKMPF